mmetsp:Transcript_127467/g.248410  ORF Transcript_127467/g.248410 Transcript_127467/m.248410 type:complete len:307 (+) Transcript_127467:73-993(+)
MATRCSSLRRQRDQQQQQRLQQQEQPEEQQRQFPIEDRCELRASESLPRLLRSRARRKTEQTKLQEPVKLKQSWPSAEGLVQLRPTRTPVTSESHPIGVSWISRGTEGRGSLGLCFCPGKRLQRSRLRAGHEEAGRPILRDLSSDLRRLREHFGCGMLVCLLNEAELRTLGVRCDYQKAVVKLGFQYVHYPVIEGASAAEEGSDGMEAAHDLIETIVKGIMAGVHVVMHCRGGVGRAGMVGACALLLLNEADTPQGAITLVRRRRCKQAVETRRQEEFVHFYAALIGRSARGKKASICQKASVTGA